MGNSIAPNIDNASKTGVLQLSNKKLEKVPEAAEKLKSNLRNIDVSNNRLLDIPLWICYCSNLKSLNFTDNRLIELPRDIGKLQKLEQLVLSMNQIYMLPSSLSQCNNLRNVYLNNNRLQIFPIEFCQNPPIQLDLLDVSKNSIVKIPEDIANLQAVELNINHNQVNVLSEKIAQCPRLKVLRVEYNALPLTEMHTTILSDSKISLLCCDGNLFSLKNLENRTGYDKIVMCEFFPNYCSNILDDVVLCTTMMRRSLQAGENLCLPKVQVWRPGRLQEFFRLTWKPSHTVRRPRAKDDSNF